MDLNEFGTEPLMAEPKRPELVASENSPARRVGRINSLVQWAHYGAGEFVGSGATADILPPGMYTVSGLVEGNPIFRLLDIKVDDLIRFDDSVSDAILREIDGFWKKKDEFSRRGFLHRRGYLMYGPQGSGKTAVVQQIIRDVVDHGDIVLLYSPYLEEGLHALRRVEPARRLVCVFEDIDAIIRDHGEENILSILDGENQIDRVLNIATTNYPGRLDKRIVSRPRRFDRVIKINLPGPEIRREYLSLKLKLDNDDVEEWIKKTDGLSFAALAEAIISVKCLGNDLDHTVDILRKMSKDKFSDDDLSVHVGFGKTALGSHGI